MWSYNPVYVISGSVWPILVSLSIFNLILGIAVQGLWGLVVYMIVLILSVVGWVLDSCFELNVLGYSSEQDKTFDSMGVLLIILSEAMLFAGLFWVLLQVSLEGSVGSGFVWHNVSGVEVDVMDMPLLISVVLLSSGVGITWAHSAIYLGDFKGFVMGYMVAILLGVVFLLLQWHEYSNLGMVLSGGMMPSMFYTLTMFHGSHVLLGVMINVIALVVSVNWSTSLSYSGLEISMWYWHFVDVVWLMLFMLLYWFSM
uniref:Cytochrome c oxidase subunit 3 n=1 Tax=Macracanthorhynchus hirudinaceus TaxID=1032456 RepID=K3W3Y7_MACHR|nr:cytochrome c oxidase subunit III [Macracanthorhynchus hirudinaceus]CCA94500.2 Cytochrome oxidase subunit 3 [Macracanthorhynchus hirudinaceus]